MPQGPTVETIAFLMEAVIDGRLDRVAAHRLVSPWVEGDEVAREPGVLSGATILHGLDLVSGDRPGLSRHADEGDTIFQADDEEVRGRCRAWLQCWRS